MTEERTLVANLVPKLADNDMQSFVQSLQNALNTDLNLEVNLGNGQSGEPPEVSLDPETVEQLQEITEVVTENSESIIEMTEETRESRNELQQTLDEFNSNIPNVTQGLDESSPSGQSRLSGLKDMLGDTVGKLAGTLGAIGMAVLGAVRMGFGMIEKVISYLKGRSPVLRTVLEMFENVLNILLMPMFTALGIELIPLLRTVYDKVFDAVQAIWKAYEEGGLAGIIAETITQLFNLITDAEIWELLITTATNIVSAVLNGIGKAVFGEENWNRISEMFFNIESISKWMGDIAHFFGYGADKKTDEELVTTILMNQSNPLGQIWNWADYVELAKRTWGFAEGGVVEPTPGGTLVNVAEAGEREYIIPQSKVSSFVQSNSSSLGGNNYYYITVSGYTDTDLTEKIVSAIDRRTDMSRLMGGF